MVTASLRCSDGEPCPATASGVPSPTVLPGRKSPQGIEDAQTALVDTRIGVEEAETDIEASVPDSDQIQPFLEREEQPLHERVEAVAATGGNIEFLGKAIDDMFQDFLAEAGNLAVRRVKSNDLDLLAGETDATIIYNADDIEADNPRSPGWSNSGPSAMTASWSSGYVMISGASPSCSGAVPTTSSSRPSAPSRTPWTLSPSSSGTEGRPQWRYA